jgi:hypothetical protein
MTANASSELRITELDGLRGLAVAMVLVWHFVEALIDQGPTDWQHPRLTSLCALALLLSLILTRADTRRSGGTAPTMVRSSRGFFLHIVPVSPNCAGLHVPAGRSPGAHFFRARRRLGGGGTLRNSPLGVYQPEMHQAPTHPDRAPVPLLTAITKTTT